MIRIIQRAIRAVVVWSGAVPSEQGTTRATESTACDLTPAPLTDPGWTDEDRAHLAQFLSSPIGKTLLARGHAWEFRLCRQACWEPFQVEHAAGIAKGWRQCLEWMESLSRAAARSTAAPEAEPDQAPHPEDTPPVGDTALREQYSL